MNTMIISFLAFMGIFVLIGGLSMLRSRGNTSDYLIASQSISPLFAALSAVSTNNSGYMFVGMIGFTYLTGLSSIWLMVGWITGDFIMSVAIYKKLRIMTGKQKSLSYPQLLCEWGGHVYPLAQFILGLITVIFLVVYAAAQLKAGGKALHFLFKWHYETGTIIGCIIIVLYCFAGGIRASIWTDVAQSFVMLAAMTILYLSALRYFGGISSTLTQLNAISPHYMSLFPASVRQDDYIGFTLFIAGWLFAGFGIIGQPHIMIRFMALKHENLLWRTRCYYYLWYTLFYLLTIGVGLLARLMFTNPDSFDPEIALLKLAQYQLPPMLIGTVLAGLFAATISTADSQVLSCTASVTQDLLRNRRGHFLLTKFITLCIAAGALLIALYADDNVFQLVLIAWSALSAVFAPILILHVMNQPLKQWQIILISSVALAVTLIWREMGLSPFIYEVMPGMLAGLGTYLMSSAFIKIGKNKKIRQIKRQG